MTSEVGLDALKGIVAERTTPILLWIGAGLSVPAGLPSWAKLRNELLGALREKAAEIGDGRDKVLAKLRAAEALSDEPWRSFQMLKEGLGPPYYETLIRSFINPGAVSALPEGYRLIAKLKPRAVLNLNIDRLATRALGSSDLIEFVGKEIDDHFGVFRSPRRFVANLHGDIDRSSTWVFTESELRQLTERPQYSNFLNNCLTQFCCVFVGISPFDVAVGGHLARLAELAPTAGPHFWLTDVNTYEMDQWAQKVRVLPIRYPAVAGDHQELYRLIESIIEFSPKEEVQAPVPPSGLSIGASSSLPSADELSRLDAEQIRISLNEKAKEILATGTADSYREFAEFSQDYEIPIYRAWHVSDRPPNNKLLGFSVASKAGGGAFGTVYRAVAPTSEEVAVKVLHQAARAEPEMLQGFRRGVRAMQLLTEAGLPRVSKYVAASEIPAFVVMDWVNGPTLKELINSKALGSEVYSRLEICIQVAETIKSAHALPARVLHRDVRPTNILLRDYWESRDVDTVVLDFDLSWHKDAQELSIVQGASSSGYLAPEQLDPVRKVPTRTGLVDSFGVGMTIFFVFSGRDPFPGESLHTTWGKTLQRLGSEWRQKRWSSFGNRMARLIEVATRSVQAERWDLSQISAELRRLQNAVDQQVDLRDADLLAEELLARSNIGEYLLEDGMFCRKGAAGTMISLKGSGDGKQIEIRLAWTDAGHNDHKRVKKWIGPALQAITQMLESIGWNIESANAGSQELEVIANVDVESVSRKLDAYSQNLARASERLAFA